MTKSQKILCTESIQNDEKYYVLRAFKMMKNILFCKIFIYLCVYSSRSYVFKFLHITSRLRLFSGFINM